MLALNSWTIFDIFWCVLKTCKFHSDFIPLRVSPDFLYEPPLWYQNSKKEVFPWKLNNLNSGLSFYPFSEEKDDYLYNDKNMFQPFDMYRVIVHSPQELPFRAGHHFFLGKHDDSEIYVKTEITSINKDLESWTAEQRKCFLDGEKKLNFFKIYSKANCEHECLSETILETCGCVPFYMIREWHRLYKILWLENIFRKR